MTTQTSTKQTLNPMLKLILEMGPLVVFFMANSKPLLFAPFVSKFLSADILAGEQGKIIAATALFMVAMLASLIVTFILTRHLPIMPLVTAVVVLIFGGLTLYFNDAMFIKLKPTIVNTLFGLVLLGGLALGKALLPVVLDSVLHLDDMGWRKLTLRWGVFFLVLAGLNELVWRTQSDDFWVNFKVWGTMPITILFAILQTPLILKHQIDPALDKEHL
jgi:intracellular septation protein